MKVVMLGHSSVGKTTYMASMYGELQTRVNGLGLRAKRRSDHDQLLHIHRSLSAGLYPDPSDQRAEYEFVLTYRRRDFFPFTWLDYRGGALGEHRGSDQTRQLVEDLKDADGILIFCDGEVLARRGSMAARSIGRITTLVGQALASFENPIPLGVVLTKADLVDDIDEEMLAPLQGLVSAVTASERVLGTIIPVACGRQPVNVQVPVLYILHFSILYQVAVVVQTIEAHAERKASFDRRSGFLDDVISFFASEPTFRELAAAELAKAEALAEQLDVLRAPVEALGAYLDGIETF